MRTGLVAHWQPALFKTAKEENLDLVDSSINSTDLWNMNAVIRCVTSEIENFRGWRQGCARHPHECQESRRHESTFRCPAKSRRGPELWAELGRRAAQWRQRADAASPTDFGTEDLVSSLREGLAAVAGQCRRKLGYCLELPWSLWRVREVEGGS